ncbi:MAG: hypothetical protein RI907_2611, partial [Pseudomonadota bacterium]
MPTLAMSAGKVTAIWGQAFLKLPNGKLQALKVGDKLLGGEKVITSQDGIVEISPAKGHPILAKLHPEPVLAQPEIEIEPAAGPGGASGGMLPGLRVDRVQESVGQLEFRFDDGARRGGGDRFDGEEKRVGSKGSTVSIAESVTVNEGVGTISFVISLDKASNKPVTVNYSTQDGTAVAGQDYVAKQGSVTFQPGETSKTVTIQVTNDDTYEGPQSFAVQIDSVSGANKSASQDVALVIINDDGTGKFNQPDAQPDDDRPVLAVAGDNADEGSPLGFVVSLSQPSTTAVKVSLTLAPGGAGSEAASVADDTSGLLEMETSPGVWVPVNGNAITFEPGVTEVRVRVATTDDAAHENTEYLKLQAKVESGVTANTEASGQAAIIDNDPDTVVVSVDPLVSDAKVAEGADLIYKVVLSQASDQPTTYAFALGGGTVDGDDIGTVAFSDGVEINADGTITVPAGVSSFTITVPTIQDDVKETNETLPLTVGGKTANGTILDDDATPTIQSVEPGEPGTGDDSVTEGSPLVFNVALSNASASPTTFAFELGAGTAGAGDMGKPVFSDGVVLNADGTITVPGGVTSFSVTVPTVDDTTKEAAETVPLTIGGVAATGTIEDNDTTPTIQSVEAGAPGLAGDAVTEGEDIVYTVKLSHA